MGLYKKTVPPSLDAQRGLFSGKREVSEILRIGGNLPGRGWWAVSSVLSSERTVVRKVGTDACTLAHTVH